jgi:hypothetical protein
MGLASWLPLVGLPRNQLKRLSRVLNQRAPAPCETPSSSPGRTHAWAAKVVMISDGSFAYYGRTVSPRSSGRAFGRTRLRRLPDVNERPEARLATTKARGWASLADSSRRHVLFAYRSFFVHRYAL